LPSAGRATTACALALLPLAACRHAPDRPPETRDGAVQVRQLPAQADDRYERTEDVAYETPAALADNPMPEYPPALLAERLPERSTRVRLIVDAEGRVAEIRPLDATADTAADSFAASVRAACAQWRFSPLVERTRVPVETTDADGTVWTEYRERRRGLPFHLDYAFRFAQVDGKAASVTADGGRPPAQ
jgi:hypothetical protein